MFKAGLIAALAVAVASTSALAHPRGHWGHGGGMFQRADTDGDGAISRDEYRAWQDAVFAKRDRNSDGLLDEADRAEDTTKRRHRAARGATLRKQLDTDNDGKISKVEFVDGAMARFDRWDTDGNGVLDAKEIETARNAMRERMKEHKRDSRQTSAN